MEDEKCVFCREVKGDRETNFARIYPELKTRFIMSSVHFHIMPCIGQLSETHCLLIPKVHYCNFRSIHPEFIPEIQELISQFNEVLANPKDDDLLIFEHGAIGPSDGGCGIYHAHLHIMGVPKSFDPNCLHSFRSNRKFEAIDESLLTTIPRSKPYLLVGSRDKGFKVDLCTEKIPSQYLRKQFATKLGIREWDWGLYKSQRSFYELLNSVRNYPKSAEMPSI